LVSVTPGHKRIEEGSLTSMLNTIDWIKDLAAKNKFELAKIDTKFLRAELKKLSYDVLYHRLNPKTVDAIRNDYTPRKLSKECFEYLCRSNVRTVLGQKEFDKLDPKDREELINNAESVEKVTALVKNFIKQEKIPKEAEIPGTEEYHPLSLVQAAGKRIYTEGSGAKETGPKYRQLLENYEMEGSPISHAFGMDNAECLAILTGNPAYVDSSAKRGPVPSPEGLSKEHFDKEMALYRKYLQTPPGTLIPEREHILTAAEGLHEFLLQHDDHYDLEHVAEKGSASSKLKSPTLTRAINEHDRTISMLKVLTQEAKKL